MQVSISNSSVLAQMQQLQAQRNADQAVQRAHALQDSARRAQAVAVRAQENARSLQVESRQANGEAAQAQRSVAGLQSLGETQAKLDGLDKQLGKILAQVPFAGISGGQTPVVNAEGQETGTLVNVTA